MRPKYNLRLLPALKKQQKELLHRYENLLRIVWEIEYTNAQHTNCDQPFAETDPDMSSEYET